MLMDINAEKRRTCHLLNWILIEIYGERTEWKSYTIQLLLKVTYQSLFSSLKRRFIPKSFVFNFMSLSCLYIHTITWFCFQFLHNREWQHVNLKKKDHCDVNKKFMQSTFWYQETYLQMKILGSKHFEKQNMYDGSFGLKSKIAWWFVKTALSYSVTLTSNSFIITESTRKIK